MLLNFSAPIFVAILGLLLFRFALNRAVLIAVVIGFAGTALILKPGTALFELGALVGLAAAVLGGFAVVAVWRMPKEESAGRIAVTSRSSSSPPVRYSSSHAGHRQKPGLRWRC